MGSLVGNVPSLNLAGYLDGLGHSGCWLNRLPVTLRDAVYCNGSHWLHGDVFPEEPEYWKTNFDSETADRALHLIKVAS